MRPPYFLLVLVLVVATCSTVQRSAARREREARIARIEAAMKEESLRASTAAVSPRRLPAPYVPPPGRDNWERSLSITREECERVRPTQVRTTTGAGGMTVQTYHDADCSRLRSSGRR